MTYLDEKCVCRAGLNPYTFLNSLIIIPILKTHFELSSLTFHVSLSIFRHSLKVLGMRPKIGKSVDQASLDPDAC